MVLRERGREGGKGRWGGGREEEGEEGGNVRKEWGEEEESREKWEG